MCSLSAVLEDHTSQAARPGWPAEASHAMGIGLGLRTGVGWGGGKLSPLLVSVSLNHLLFRSLNFVGNFVKFAISGSCDRCLATDCDSVIMW